MALVPRLKLAVVASLPVRLLADGVIVRPAFQWVTSLGVRTSVSGRLVCKLTPPKPRPCLVISSRQKKGEPRSEDD